jgi:hypothetical protein
MAVLLAMFGCKCDDELEVEGKSLVEWVSLLRHADWATQVEAQDKISRLGPRAVPYLSKMVWAKDPTLRKGVVATLARIGPDAGEAIPTLLKRMKVEKVAAIRVEILVTLAGINPKAEGVKEEFTKRLKDLAPEVRVAAERGLKKLETPKPEEKKEPDQPAKPVEKEGFALREQLASVDKLQGIGFGLVAEVVREKRRAAVVWPAIKDGKILDDDIVAFVYERAGGEWKLSKGNIGLSAGQGANKLSEALGGADKQKVIRECGVDRDKLALYLEEKGKAFREALAAGDAASAVQAYEELTRAFTFRLVAYDDMLPEMLINQGFEPAWKIGTAAKGLFPVEATVKGMPVRGWLRLGSCGGKIVISDLIEEK